jgi:hypothetical protein
MMLSAYIGHSLLPSRAAGLPRIHLRWNKRTSHKKESSRHRQGAILESSCTHAQFSELHTLPLFVKIIINTKPQQQQQQNPNK